MKLVPCPECRRHLHAAEARCPFCDAPLAFVPLAPSAPRGLSRAHRYALNAALIVAASCGGETSTPSGGDAAVAEGGGAEGGSDSGKDAAVEAAGDAAQDAAQDSGIADAADEPDGRICCPPYGCVFPDACGPVRV